MLLKFVAEEISKKKIVGFFNGRMEFGARALGNRSIIADPRELEIRNILNLKIKRRESFRPFAPSILKEFVKDWFEIDDDVPFMSKVYKVKNDKKIFVPAVVHVDGTCRLQTVDGKYNRDYYDLIQEFYKITNIPIILNTSFNENEPIVRNPENAIECFLRTKMDHLVIENYILSRK
jgi:carbamoyltransferase